MGQKNLLADNSKFIRIRKSRIIFIQVCPKLMKKVVNFTHSLFSF